MAEDTKTPAAADAPANTTIQRPAPSTPAETAAREGRVAQSFEPAMGAAPTPKHVARSTLITNPTPANDPTLPEPVEDNTPAELPQSTIAEMEAGRKALERNKPVNAKAALQRGESSEPAEPKKSV